ncbi:MAG: lysylphosphatidylglycerol synthase transmembrane domain-containing protein [bacterium]|jgi:uncharacterized membrane protein YbhN (UPF0104 family)
MKSKRIQLFIAVLIGILCLYFFARKMNWKELLTALQQANYGYVIIAILLQYVAMWLRALRWQSFLGTPWVSVSKLFLIANIGFMGNGVFPARLGELIRPFLVWQKTQHTFPTALATIVVERVFDLLVILLILAFSLSMLPVQSTPASASLAELTTETGVEIAIPADSRDWIQDLGYLGALVFLALLSAMLFMTYAPNWSYNLAARIFRPLPEKVSVKLLEAIRAFEQGASTFRRPASFLFSFLITVILWVVIAYSELIILWAFGVNHVGIIGGLFLMTGLCFAVMFPQLPGYIGVYQFAVVAILSNTFAVDESVAGAIAIVMWLTQVPPIILMGFICLMILGVSFSEITHVQEEIPVSEDKPQQVT